MLNKKKLERGNQNPTSHRALHTSQNGITLIALIITIIVMLIVVGVTVNVALKDIELPTGWKGTNGTYTSPKGNTYTVDENGKIVSGESKSVEPPILELVQIDEGTYTDHTLIGLNLTINSFEQIMSMIEWTYLNSVYEDGYPETFEEYILARFNEELESNYTTIEEIQEEYGITYEEFIEDFFLGKEWESIGIGNINGIELTINVKKPDNTVVTFEEVKTYFEGSELEGVYWYHSLSDLKCGGTCYSATQTGTYEITLSFMDYVITDTITIENF